MIDFSIIWKHLHGISTSEEEQSLNNWLLEKPENQLIFNKVFEYYNSGSDSGKADKHKEETWQIINKTIRSRDFRYRKLAYGALSIAAAAVLFLLIYVFRDKVTENPVIYTESAVIEPGSSKALLFLDDGSQIDLSSSSPIKVNEGGVMIERQGTYLEYNKGAEFEEIPEPKFNTLRIPYGGEFFIILSDQTKVWLNSGTELKYPVHFTGNTRVVELSGEAYFEVSKDHSRPFLVKTGDQITKVLGTTFNISGYPEDSLIFTTLVEGNVMVYMENRPNIMQTLNPSQQSYFYKNENIISKRNVNTLPYVAWKDGRFYFERQKLGEIMHTLSRWYDIEIMFANQNTKDLRFTGDLKRYEDFEQILKLIQTTNEISYSISGRKVVIK